MTHEFIRTHPGLRKQIIIKMKRMLKKLLLLKWCILASSGKYKVNLSGLDKTECLSDIEDIIDKNLPPNTESITDDKNGEFPPACEAILTEMFKKLSIPSGNASGYSVSLKKFGNFKLSVESECWVDMIIEMTDGIDIYKGSKKIKYEKGT